MHLNRSSVMFVYNNLVTDDRNAYIGLFASAIKTDNVRFLIHCQEYCFPDYRERRKIILPTSSFVKLSR